MPESYRVVAKDRFLTVEPAGHVVRVGVGEQEWFRSSRALMLREGGRDPVYYIPADDIPAELLEPISQQYQCRWKGTANYYNIRRGDVLMQAAAWCYDNAPDEVASIRRHVSFDTEQLNVVRLTEAVSLP